MSDDLDFLDSEDGGEEEKVTLTPCQERALTALSSGKNVFLTGDAGTGKSYVLKHWLMNNTTKNYAVTASTGVAALLAGGRTTHSFFGIGRGTDKLEDLLKSRFNSRAEDRIRRTSIVVIDEVSMLGAQVFEKIEACARQDKGSDAPWGGLQIIAVGDFGQLPPVEDEFCFESPVWKRSKFVPIMLRTQVRSADERFSRILKKVRNSDLDEEVYEFLKQRYNPGADDTWVRGLPRKRDAEHWNQKKLFDLNQPIFNLRAVCRGQEWAIKSIISAMPVPENLGICHGAYVMIRKNDPDGQYANGTTGYVMNIANTEITINLADASGQPSGQSIALPRNAYQIESDSRDEPLGVVYQFPIHLAWAVTIHKLQGATLTHAAIDLSELWEPGQAYVALSRVRRPDDVAILGWSPMSFKTHPRVRAFYDIVERLG